MVALNGYTMALPHFWRFCNCKPSLMDVYVNVLYIFTS